MPDEHGNSVTGSVYGPVVEARDLTRELRVHTRPVVPLPHWFGSRPPRALGFQERRIPLSGTVVLTGPGGVGKSQLAADLAERRWVSGRARLVVWVRAGSREEIVAEYARVGAALTGVRHRDAEVGALRFLEWLASAREPWLVVIDDVRSPAHLDGLCPTGRGQVVVTTRHADSALGPLVDVPVFAPAEAAGYLAAVVPPDLLAGADELADRLGRLPLALALAAADLTGRGTTCRDHGKRLRRRLAESGPVPDDCPAALAATVALSVEHANGRRPRGMAERLLRVASVLDPDGVPAPVFASTAIRGRARLEDVREGLAVLQRLGLASVDQEVRVHALVQRVVRAALSPQDRAAVARAAASALLEVWPDVEQDAAHARSLRANAAALDDAAGDALGEDGYPVLIRATQSLGESGQPVAAAADLLRLAQSAAERWGHDHPVTLVIRSRHAHWQGEAGDPAGAAKRFADVLTDRLRVLGPDDPAVAATRGALSTWRERAGAADSASLEFAALLAEQTRALGPDHPDTLHTRGLLATALVATGDPASAATALADLAADQSRVLGADHPDTLTTRFERAVMLLTAGELSTCATELADLLTDRLRVLGPDHTDTLRTRGALAVCRWQAGDTAVAEEIPALLADCLRVLGPDHPDTLTVQRYQDYLHDRPPRSDNLPGG
ncbi:tetratricopeptide repeat protein [Actinokineospora sp. UTMC 2448]|uniref:tetratricopeptide repeat protein n=1 Tax=Actinokineospora sp. UTMC 2448 TaxID=2268449 RepID=UPI002164BF79|nr:tetratricopeptide repeat protein [Actinokineospora sp. UTMC 2448]